MTGVVFPAPKIPMLYTILPVIKHTRTECSYYTSTIGGSAVEWNKLTHLRLFAEERSSKPCIVASCVALPTAKPYSVFSSSSLVAAMTATGLDEVNASASVVGKPLLSH